MPDGAIVQRIPVHFTGPGAGTAPLTWGQKAILKDMRETGWTHNVSWAPPLAPTVTVDDVAEQLRELMSVHPALRMRMGHDADGRPCQVVAESGDTALEVYDVADDADPEQIAHELWYSRLLTAFDFERDWAMQMAVVRHRGVARSRPLTLHHLVADGGTFALLVDELGRDEAERSATDPDTVGLLELGHREQTPAVRRISAAAMRYWEARLRTIPALTFGEPSHPDGRLGHRYWHGRSSSPAAYLAVLAIAARTGTDTSRVLLAIIATAIARVTGASSLTAKVIVSNRFRRGFAKAIAPLSQNSVVTVDVADATVDEVVARARQASLVAAKNAYYDPDDLDELTARLDDERGYPARVSCRINDRRTVTRMVADGAAKDGRVTAEQIDAARSQSEIFWDGTLERLPEQAFITIEDYYYTVYLQVIFDMNTFTEGEVEALLRGVEEVAIEAAFDPAAPALRSLSPGHRQRLQAAHDQPGPEAQVILGHGQPQSG